MRSSTSSSERAVWPIFAVAALIVGCYQALVPRLMPGGGAGHDQRQQNLIEAQRLVDGDVSPQIVAVGSSKLARLTFAPSTGIYNLAQNGGSSLTGLEVLRRAPITPRRVLVEVGDTITRPVDHDLLDTLFNAVNRRLRRWLPVLQDQYQPGVLANELARRWASSRVAIHGDQVVRPELLQQLVDTQLEAHAQPPDPIELDHAIRALRQAIDALRAKGTSIVFVELPEDDRVWRTPECVATREALHRAFPEIAWAPLAEPTAYRTTDGVHLEAASADRVAAEIGSWIAAQR